MLKTNTRQKSLCHPAALRNIGFTGNKHIKQGLYERRFLPAYICSMNSTPGLQVQVTNRQILSIALPIAASILVPQVNYITNNIFLGRLGETPLAVAGITGVYYLIFAAIGMGFNNGLQMIISRRAGEGRSNEIGRIFSQGIFLSMGIAAFAVLFTYTLMPFILKQVLADDTRYQMAADFLKIRIWGLPFLYIYQMRNALLVGTNNSRFLVAGTLAETVANVALDYVLIFGALGFPQLGFNGAAFASIAAEGIGMLVVFAVIHFKGISQQFQLYKNWGVHRATIRLIVNQSAPLVFQFAISIVSWEFFYILIERNVLVTTDLAISNVMRNVFGFFGCFSWAFAAASNTMVSNIIGQGKSDRVMELIWKIVRISLCFSLGSFLLLNLFPQVFLGIFGQGDAFIQHGIPTVRIVSSALIIMSAGTVCLNAVTGTGNTRINLIIEIVAIVLYCTYTWLVLEKLKLGIIWGWGSEWLYWLSMLIMSFIYLKSGRWKGKQV